MNSRILMSVLAIGVALMMGAAGGLAYFHDTESSTNNSFQAGTLDLTPDTIGTIAACSPAAPGDSSSTTVTLKNEGSLSADHLEINVTYSEVDRSDSTDYTTDKTATETAKAIKVTTLSYGGNSLLYTGSDTADSDDSGDKVDDVNGNGIIDLDDLKRQSGEGTELDGLDDPGSGGKDFVIELTLTNVGNDFQNDGVSIDYTFDLNQVSGQ